MVLDSNTKLALVEARQFLETDPANAESKVREILRMVPECREAQFLLGAALCKQGDAKSARAILEPLVDILPVSAELYVELGRALGELGMHDAALGALSRATNLDGNAADAWQALSEQLFASGDQPRSDAASTRAAILAVRNPSLRKQLVELDGRASADLEELLLEFLETEPDDVDALELLAEITLNNGRNADAEGLLEHCLELAPDYSRARYNYASALLRSDKFPQAIAELERLLARAPRNPFYRSLKGEALLGDGRFEDSILWYEQLVHDYPDLPLVHLGYALTLSALGRNDECVAVYRKMVELFPRFESAYWGLANLQGVRFTDKEFVAIQDQLARTDLSPEDRVFLHFSLGRAYEKLDLYEKSFQNYAEANAIQRANIGYESKRQSLYMSKCSALFTRDFFDERSAAGCASGNPIFIVGLPRSGSSLIDQILSSHSAIEGIGELTEILSLARNIHYEFPGSDYPEVLEMLDSDELTALGKQYLSNCQPRRKLGRPYFIDKAPRNFIDIGLIHLILPNAKIIDVRRHPLGCCFSNFSQYYSSGQPFTYSLTDLGIYYRDYVRLMAHYDEVLPGKIHRIYYEDVVGTFEKEVRRLLDYLELPFEEQCLRFHDSARYVRTASSDQVRMPIYKNAVEHWRNFEPWLDPLKAELGSALAAYPDVPIDLK
jgi:tetratricopeptide (TPR) repeat protein